MTADATNDTATARVVIQCAAARGRWRPQSPTTIDEGAFVGSNSILVAPVRIGRGAYIAAGSVITKDVPEGALGLGRARQENKPGWANRRPKKS